MAGLSTAGRVLTYAQAKASGIDVPPTPAELGQKACPPLPGNVLPGFSSEADMNKAIAATPRNRVCAADPTGDRFLVDSALLSSTGGPTGQYRWVGARFPRREATSAARSGSRCPTPTSTPAARRRSTNGYVNASSTSTRCVISGQQYNAWVQR